MSQTSPGALAGIRVIDLTRVLGGPYCTQILGDHGAEVIKVEPPQGDETRAWGPPVVGDTAAYYIGVNRNKRGIVLDLTEVPAREALLALLEDADVLVENFKTGTLEKWGLGYEQLLARRFPRLVHCRVSGFGEDGPLGGLPGYDAVVQAMTGVMSVNGEVDGGPLRVGIPVIDIATGLNAAIGILMALQERNRSGQGQFVDVSLYDCGISLLHPHVANFLASGRAPRRSGNAHPNIAPYDSFRTGSAPIFLGVGNDGQFRKLCTVLEKPELADDPRFLTNAQRNAHRGELKQALEAILAEHEGVALAGRLMQAGVPCGPVLGVDQVISQPHTQHRQMIVDIGDYRGTGSPIKLGRTPAAYRRPPPALGEHTAEITGHGRPSGTGESPRDTVSSDAGSRARTGV